MIPWFQDDKICHFPDLPLYHPPNTHTIKMIKAWGKIPLEGHIFKSETLMGTQSLLITFFKHRLIKPCQSSCRTPDLPIHKPNEEYQFVQDLQALNVVDIPIHPVVSNPHTLLPKCLPADTQYFCFGPQSCIFLYSPTSILLVPFCL